MPKASRRAKRASSAGVARATAAVRGARDEQPDLPEEAGPLGGVGHPAPSQEGSDQTQQLLLAIHSELRQVTQRQDAMEERYSELTAGAAQPPQPLPTPPQQAQDYGQPGGSGPSLPAGQPEAQLFAEQIVGRNIAGFETSGEPVDLFLDSKIKHRILAHEAVDFSLLIGKGKAGKAWKISNTDEGPTFVSSDTNFAPIGQMDWRDAWNIFQAVYCSVHNQKDTIMGLAIHFANVSRLMKRKGDWALYDVSFRKLVEIGKNHWGDTNGPLYSRCLLPNETQAAHQPKKQGKNFVSAHGLEVQPGFCIDFHVKGKCTRAQCRYNHTCCKCYLEVHPASYCQAEKGAAPQYGPQKPPQQPPFRKGPNGPSKRN